MLQAVSSVEWLGCAIQKAEDMVVVVLNTIFGAFENYQ